MSKTFNDPHDLNVQFPVFTPINPDIAQAKADPEALKSYQFIEKFNARDTAPITVVDDATQAARNQQIIKLTKRLCARATEKATDAQVLALHRDYFAGRY